MFDLGHVSHSRNHPEKHCMMKYFLLRDAFEARDVA
jgi:hypothetical protein